jgi:hypothetical protein
MEKFNATFFPCRYKKVVDYFFESDKSDLASTLATCALALAAAEVDLGQLAAAWPVRPQKRQRLSLKWHSHSSGRSLPSLPNLLEMSEDLGVLVDLELLLLEEDDAAGAGIFLSELRLGGLELDFDDEEGLPELDDFSDFNCFGASCLISA